MSALTGSAGDGFSLGVTLTVLLAALAHATWNAIAHDIRDKLVAFALVGLGGGLCGGVMTVLAPLPAPASLPYLAASVVLHVLYLLLLMRCYRLGEFGQVYPIARGSAPLVVTLLAAVLIGEIPSPAQLIGITVVSAGLASLVLLGTAPTRADRAALLAAFATGLTIAAFTVVDGIGVRLSGTPLGYAAWLLLFHGLAIPVYAYIRRGPLLIAQLRPTVKLGLTGGALSFLAYGLVLWAQTQGPLAPIAALRETSIIIGAAIGSIAFQERFGRSRVIAAVLVVVGIVALNLG